MQQVRTMVVRSLKFHHKVIEALLFVVVADVVLVLGREMKIVG